MPGPIVILGVFVADLVKRYPLSAGVEVWNEPNLRAYWGSIHDAAGYVRLVRLTSARLVKRCMFFMTS